MKKCITFFISCFILIEIVNSQDFVINLYRNVFYLEGATKGSYYSLNYDHIFYLGQKQQISYSVEFSLLKETISLPIGKSLFDNNSTSDKYLFITPTIGYRFQSSRSKIFFKVQGGPLLSLDPATDNFWRTEPKIYPYASVAFGLAF